MPKTIRINDEGTLRNYVGVYRYIYNGINDGISRGRDINTATRDIVDYSGFLTEGEMYTKGVVDWITDSAIKFIYLNKRQVLKKKDPIQHIFLLSSKDRHFTQGECQASELIQETSGFYFIDYSDGNVTFFDISENHPDEEKQ